MIMPIKFYEKEIQKKPEFQSQKKGFFKLKYEKDIKIYCVARTISADRKIRMDRRFKNRGLSESVVYVDAVEYTDPIVKKYRPIETLTEMESKYAACFLSHLKTLGIFLDTDAQSCLVCENDILLHNDFSHRLKNIVEACPESAPIISLGYFNGRDGNYSKISPPESKEDIRNIGIDLIWGMQMYWISRKYAEACVYLFDRNNFGYDKSGIYPGLVARIESNKKDNFITPEIILRKSVTGCLVIPPLAIEDCIMSDIGGKKRANSHIIDMAKYNYRITLTENPWKALCRIK